MNVYKVPKLESSYANRDRCLGSSANSKAVSSKAGTSHTVDGVKKSSSKTTTSWNASCRRFLCSFGGSKSKPSDPDQVSLVKKKQTRSLVTDYVPGLKIVKELSKNDSSPSNNTLVVASHKVGSPCITKKERKSGVAGQTNKSKQSTPTLSDNIPPPVPVMKKQMQKTAGPKDPPIHNPKSTVHKNQTPKHLPPSDLNKKVEKFQVSNDFPVATQKVEFHKTEGPKASMVTSLKRGVPKPDDSKDSLISTRRSEARRVETLKTSVSKVPAAPVTKIGTTKTSTKIGTTKTSTTVPDKDRLSSSQHQPHLDIPSYYIRWDGDDKEPEVSGQNCMLCEKDLSCLPHGKDYEPSEGDEYDDEYEFDIHFRPQLLPAVDFLPCGHVFHSECSQHLIPDGKSTDRQCVFCLSMA